MCLCIDNRLKNSKQPYNNKKIRWKVVYVTTNEKRVRSGVTDFSWRQGIWNNAINNLDYYTKPGDFGFHVYITKKQAIKRAGICNLVLAVEVDIFNRAGTYVHGPCETWKRAKAIQLYTPSGKKTEWPKK